MLGNQLMSVYERIGPSRRRKRAQVFMSGVLIVNGGAARITIRDISMEGAHITVSGPLSPGLAVRLRRETLDVAGKIAWVKGRGVGIKFDFPLQPSELQETMPRALLRTLIPDGTGE